MVSAVVCVLCSTTQCFIKTTAYLIAHNLGKCWPIFNFFFTLELSRVFFMKHGVYGRERRMLKLCSTDNFDWTNCSIKLLQTLITFYTRFCRRHPMHPNTTVSDNAHIHCSCLHIPLTSLTVILLHAWCTKTVISTSHSISSVLFIYMYWLAFCHAIQ